jgi:hypothetical protein
MRKWAFVGMVLAAAAILAGCAADPLAGTVTVVIALPDLAGMNAGSNAVDQDGVNRAVSDVMVLDSSGVASVVLHASGKDVVFPGGTTLTVHCTVWVGPQTDLDTRFTSSREITISGDRIVVFVPLDNTLPLP